MNSNSDYGAYPGYALPSGRVLPTSANTHKPRLILTLMVALIFAASFSGAIIAKISGVDQFASYFQGATLALILVASVFNPKIFSSNKYSVPQIIAIWAIIAFTILQAIFWYGSGQLVPGAKGALINKSLGVCLTFVAVITGGRLLRVKEWEIGLILFALCELTLIFTALFSGIDVEFNNNNIGMRVIISCLVLFLLIERISFRWTALAVGFSLIFALQCRTSVVAAVASLSVLLLERFSRKRRAIFVIFVSVGLVVLFFTLPYLHRLITNLLLDIVGSNNWISDTLLSDKTSQDVQYDVFDRADVWEHAWKNAKDSWMFGNGLGTEGIVLGGIRSHNAYLSLIIEGGVVLLGLWTLFYAAFATKVFDSQWMARAGKEKLNRVAIVLLCYMLLAGIMESSGLGSIFSPVNLIFMFLSTYLLADTKK